MKDKRKDKGGKVKNAANSAPRDSKPTGGSGAGHEDDMINIAVLREVVELMRSNDLTEVSIVRGSDELSIRRGSSQMVVTQAQPAPVYAAPAPQAPAAPAPAAAAPAAPAAPAPATGAAIESPMVGTFYSRPNPDAKPFVTVGQTVNKDTVVCIIEAMKVFNEIKAEKDGVVESVLVKDGQAVEFGQKLFALK